MGFSSMDLAILKIIIGAVAVCSYLSIVLLSFAWSSSILEAWGFTFLFSAIVTCLFGFVFALAADETPRKEEEASD